MTTTNVRLEGYIFKVLKQVHPDTGATQGTKNSLNNLLNIVLARVVSLASKMTILGKRMTLSGADIRAAVQLLLPGKLLPHATSEMFKASTKYANAKESGGSASHAAKAGLTFPPTRILGAKNKGTGTRKQVRNVRALTSANRVSDTVGVKVAALLEYLAAEILELAGNLTRDDKKVVMTQDHLRDAIQGDLELATLFEGVLVAGTYITYKAGAGKE